MRDVGVTSGSAQITQRLQLRVRGAVQGVGFRPFACCLAREMGLTGWVANGAAGATLELEGPDAQLARFRHRLTHEIPPPGHVQRVEATWLPLAGFSAFEIRSSRADREPVGLVLPDVATCDDCRREIFDPTERRYRYPFTNCAHCGPRFTIIDRLPYDRARTTMARFEMCDQCRAEYESAEDRRFHAQPIACPDCGPQLAMWDHTGHVAATRDDALRAAEHALLEGQIVAAKGLGGFHLLVDADNHEAIARLRQRKARDEKPLALMYPDLHAVRRDAELSGLEAELLQSPEAPIVLLHRRRDAAVSPGVAPGNPMLGIMLPSNPLHHLLLADLGRPLVATSGNLADEPICTDETEALQRLGDIADWFLVHDRPIRRHVDDSIVRVVAGREMVMRRSRGYAPWPVPLPAATPPVVAVGGQMKSAVAVAVGEHAVLGQHVGDLGHPASQAAFERSVEDLQHLFGVESPSWIADHHPDYDATRFAVRRAGTAGVHGVQHHVAHVWSCLLEHGLTPPMLGVSWDGTGDGTDGTVWGGEFLHIPEDGGFERVAHLRPFRLPGGDAASREGWRSALGILHAMEADALWNRALPPVRQRPAAGRTTMQRMLETGLRSPLTSSAGRLFDAVAALVDLRQQSRFEGQAAMALEFAATEASAAEGYPFAVVDGSPLVVDWAPAMTALLDDLDRSVSVATIARRFHEGLADAVATVCGRLETARVVLTGGCFQNALLTQLCVGRLQDAGHTVYRHHRIPANDGGLALGQIAAAFHDRTASHQEDDHVSRRAG